MEQEFGLTRFDLCGVPIAAVDFKGFLHAVNQWMTHRRPGCPGSFVCFRDAHGIVRSQDEPRVREAHLAALMVVPDGLPLALLGRLRGFSGVGQVSGIEAMEAICRAGVPLGWKHYLYGAGPGVVDELRANLSRKLPGIQIVGTETPPFRELSPSEQSTACKRIVVAGADFVWVGLSSPKQELWMASGSPMLPGIMAMGVGAAFDVHAGRVKRAPKAVRVIGFEWLYRAFREPRRLLPRYAEIIPRFLWLVGLEQFRIARKSKEPGASPRTCQPFRQIKYAIGQPCTLSSKFRGSASSSQDGPKTLGEIRKLNNSSE